MLGKFSFFFRMLKKFSHFLMGPQEKKVFILLFWKQLDQKVPPWRGTVYCLLRSARKVGRYEGDPSPLAIRPFSTFCCEIHTQINILPTPWSSKVYFFDRSFIIKVFNNNIKYHPLLQEEIKRFALPTHIFLLKVSTTFVQFSKMGLKLEVGIHHFLNNPIHDKGEFSNNWL